MYINYKRTLHRLAFPRPPLGAPAPLIKLIELTMCLCSCLAHWPHLTHLEYDQLGLHLVYLNQPRPRPLDPVSLPTGLRTLSIQSLDNDQATQLFARLVAASASTLNHVTLANSSVDWPDRLEEILQPAAASLTTLEYHRIRATPAPLAHALLGLRTLKHVIMPVDMLRTNEVYEALIDKSFSPAHAPLECLTLLPEEYHLCNPGAPEIMVGRRGRLY